LKIRSGNLADLEFLLEVDGLVLRSCFLQLLDQVRVLGIEIFLIVRGTSEDHSLSFLKDSLSSFEVTHCFAHTLSRVTCILELLLSEHIV
jgi:hypothetical protein